MGVFSAGYIPVTSQAPMLFRTYYRDRSATAVSTRCCSASGLLRKTCAAMEAGGCSIRQPRPSTEGATMTWQITSRTIFWNASAKISSAVELAEDCNADLALPSCQLFPPPLSGRGSDLYYDSDVEGKRLAEAIQAELVRVLGPNKRLARPGNYRVLRDTTMPAAIVEVGFLSNPREAGLLADPHYQARVAQAVYWGILRYLRS